MTCPQVRIFVAYYVKSISGMNASLLQTLFDLRRHNFYVLHLKVNQYVDISAPTCSHTRGRERKRLVPHKALLQRAATRT